MQLKRSSSSSHSTNLKTLFINLITHSLYRLLRSLSRARSVLIEISKHNKKRLFMMMFYTTKSSMNQHNIFFGSSHVVVPVTKPFPFSLDGHVEDEDNLESQYLQWLEERVDENNNINDDQSVGERDVGDDDIDRLADKFIARCHEKFLLEKVESYRRFQDMLARSL
ncbi:hypothetical protein AtNW77_Chr2g0264471 [Arabidopsis thaliana]|uniref:Cotton fiber protein n=7 Tax=Arabidopsis TaxID=3701 RepID=Q84RF6_ARATH|nr:cotton fiber protein [Arabidopsis thaliana]KAG7639415.1 hypothetical protein ISN45_At02g037370 [Arabidopsis thaliana x Arabidopsis arenosa]KAG7644002.1 hypothetical protein ISN44_As02g037470 [Arabidopsis suecica]AAO89194.1 hypothetical protein [Arabidopsis thaliana]AAX55156.1 hypothetical protein At2g42180 [Arabidopsis thaliana]AEC10083.1 cotton fiber protein [Arabidopsis thaliana]|eukprot:NP_850364.2 cotton fiber protein [Arabidopsis thaliana]